MAQSPWEGRGRESESTATGPPSGGDVSEGLATVAGGGGASPWTPPPRDPLPPSLF